MSTTSPLVFLVAEQGQDWPARFLDAASGSYTVTRVPLSEVHTCGHTHNGARGVVVCHDASLSPDLGDSLRHVRACVHYADLPVIAVAPSPSASMRARMMAAGASDVYDADSTEPEQVLRAVDNRCDIEPVMAELHDSLLMPFVEAATHTIEEMAGSSVSLHSVYQKRGYRIFGDYSVMVNLSADSEGTLVLSFPSETGSAIAARILEPLGADLTEELLQSTLGEIGNIVTGSAKGRLANTNYRFAMSTPTVVSGHNHEVRYQPGLPCLVASFTGELGDFALQLCMALPGIAHGGES